VRTTVFLKGCPLSCAWCSNPESQRPEPQLLYFKNLCKGCAACARACPRGAMSVADGTLAFSRDTCTACGACVSACLYEARTLSGRVVTVDEVCDTVREDWRMFMQSGGGITVGGGEALMQPVFLHALLDRLHDGLGYHTCLDTCGFSSWETLRTMLPHLDLILLDIKHMDGARHRAMTGVDNGQILDNARRLGELGFPVLIRVPLIPGFNDDVGNARALGGFLHQAGLSDVELMPYHAYGLTKYAALGREYAMASGLAADVATVVEVLSSFGLHIEVHQ
jgi:pyruvate formate lyase activating enzyme